MKAFQPFYFFAKKRERPLTFFHSLGMVTFTHQRKTNKKHGRVNKKAKTKETAKSTGNEDEKTKKHLKAISEKKVWR